MVEDDARRRVRARRLRSGLRGGVRAPSTCTPTLYRVVSYDIEKQADEDRLRELKASGVSAGEDASLDPAPSRIVTLEDPYLCDQEVTPVNPTVQQAVCTGPGQYSPPSITLPADTDLLSTTADPEPVFADDLPDGWVANAAYGYADYTITLTVPDCVEKVTPPAPTWVDDCGPGNGSWEFTDAEAYTYSETVNEDGSITVRVTPNEGYSFPEGTVTEWTETDSEEPCLVDAPPDGEHYHYEVVTGLGGV
ncbi:hypothetical protein [Mumia zhuanghuii]|uniref:hypothetical protein n=1 Tax=Mumia zhuanghuii TaxID=2585211 RepID=UPI0036283A41